MDQSNQNKWLHTCESRGKHGKNPNNSQERTVDSKVQHDLQNKNSHQQEEVTEYIPAAARSRSNT